MNTLSGKPENTIIAPPRQSIFLYIAGLVLLLLATYFFYAGVHTYSFVNYDDPNVIVNNPDIQDISWQGLKKIFLNPADPVNLAPPLTVYTFALNYYFHGLDAGAFHMTNLFLHLLNVILVFILVVKISGNRLAGIFAASVLALHPSNAEAVAWVVARKELLYTCFYILSLIAVIFFWEKRNPVFFVIALLFFILSYYSKYAAASFPVLYVVLAVFWKNRKDYVKIMLESIPFFLLPLYSFYLSLAPMWGSAATTAETSAAQSVSHAIHIAPANLNNSFGFIQKIFLAGYSLSQYLFKFLVPVHQQIIYPYPQLNDSGLLPVSYYICTAICALLIIFTFRRLKKKPHMLTSPAAFGLFLFICSALLLLHFLPISGRVIIADRYLYLPSVGLAIVLFYILQWLAARWKRHYLLYGCMVIYITATSFALIKRIPDWKDSETILEDLTLKDPDYFLGYVNLGAYYIDNVRYDQAEQRLKKAVALDSSIFISQLNLGNVLIKKGALDEAAHHLRKAQALDPGNYMVYYHLSEVAMQQNDLQAVYQLLDTTIRFEPYYHAARINMAVALIKLNRYQEAIAHLEKARKLAPQEVQVYEFLGLAYTELKDYPQALICFDEGIRIQPDYYSCLMHKGRVLLEMQDYEPLFRLSEQLIEKHPGEGMGYYYRAASLLNRNNILADVCPDILKAYQLGVRNINPEVLNNCQQTAIINN